MFVTAGPTEWHLTLKVVKILTFPARSRAKSASGNLYLGFIQNLCGIYLDLQEFLALLALQYSPYGWKKNKDWSKKVDYGCRCSAKGDPHFKTCDGYKYDFQGSCTYSLVTNGCGDSPKTFEVLISTEPWRKSKATVTKEIRINFFEGGEKTFELRLDRRSGTCQRNGVMFDLPSQEAGLFSAKYDDRKVVVLFENGTKVRLEWNYDHNVEVFLGEEFKENICGLCGNYNGNSRDDLVLRSGEVVGSDEHNRFGESWRAVIESQTEECAPEVDEDFDPCSGLSQEEHRKVQNFCERMASGAFEQCYTASDSLRSYIDEQIEHCKFDFCLDISNEEVQCSYPRDCADACTREGILVGIWQERGFCGDVKCPGMLVFKTNGLADRTCSDPLDEPEEILSPGCFCPENMYLEGSRCVTIDTCGCSLDGLYLKRGERKLVNRCRTLLKCNEDGELEKEIVGPCGENAICEAQDGIETCVCTGNTEKVGDECVDMKRNTIGLEKDGELPPSSFKASSKEGDTEPWDGRLNSENCWKPESSDENPWLEVDLLEQFKVQGVRLQSCEQGDCSISEFSVHYRKDGENEFQEGETFADVNLESPYSDFMLANPVEGVTHIRIYPKNKDGCIGLRMNVIALRSNCPEKFQPNLRSCYYPVKEKKSWDKAQQICRRHGAYLVEIFNQEEEDYISELADGKDVYLGINDVDEDGSFANEHGGTTWLNFPENHDFRDGHNCVVLQARGKWSVIKCGTKRNFVCESGGGNDCPVAEGWVKLYGGCYKHIEEKMNFADAIERCMVEGGHVVEITDPNESKAVTKVSGGERVWISASDLKEEGRFVHFTSQRPLSFTSWAGNEPNDYSDGEDCAITNWKGDEMWNDVPCDGENEVVCERGQNIHHQILDICEGDKCNGGDCYGYIKPGTEEADFVCKCKGGSSGPRCTEAECNCFAWGDPHYGTCDGDKFDYQGKCSSVMAQDGCKNEAERTFQIVISTQDFPKYPGTTSVQTVYIHLDYVDGLHLTTVILDQNRKVYKNGHEMNGDFSLANKAEAYHQGGKVIFVLPNGIIVKFNGAMRIDIKMPGSMKDKVCGMCGNFNGVRFDDIIDENNNNRFDREEANKYGDLWTYGEKCAPPEPPEPIETVCEKASQDNKDLLNRAMEIIDGEDFEECISSGKINVEELKHSLRMDFCPTGSMESLCGALETLREDCWEKAKIYVCWEDRDNLMCAPPPGKNERYVCGKGFEKRCGQTVSIALEISDWVEGNFCEEGFFRNEDMECVTQAECGCKYLNQEGESQIMKPGTSVVDPLCSFKYVCNYNEEKQRYVTVEYPYGCHADAECYNGRCLCKADYEGDGYESCTRIEDIIDIEGVQLGVHCGGVISANAITPFPSQRSRRAGRLCDKDDFFIADAPEEGTEPYIQVELTVKTRITGIFTRGWFRNKCWADFVVVKYSSSLEEEWDCVKEDGDESCTKYTVSYQMRLLRVKPFRARYIRIYPGVSSERKLCIQIELFGVNKISCPEDFVTTPVGCYHKADTLMTYDDGDAYCGPKGAYLVEISSKKEGKVVADITEGNSFFLGMRLWGKSGTFHNPKGSPNIYSNYKRGEPSVMRDTAECIVVENKWSRAECAELHTIVCELGGDALIKNPPGRPLGIEFTGDILSTAFTASSYIELLPPLHGRLNMPGDNAAWCALPDDMEPFLQVDLTTRYKVTAIITQGRGDADGYTRKFTIKYSNDCENFEQLQDEEDNRALVFNANNDRNTRVLNIFENPFAARCVRIYPQVGDNGVPICLRFELYGRFIKPDKPCFLSFFARDDTPKIGAIPDRNLISSSCEELRDDPNPDMNYCAVYARWSEDWENGLWWRPGVHGRHEFIQINFGEKRIVTAIRLAVRSGPLPEFRLSCSTDAIKWSCCEYKRDNAPTPISGGEMNVYELVEWTPVKYIRINPVCDDIPELRIDIKGCPLKEEKQIVQ